MTFELAVSKAAMNRRTPKNHCEIKRLGLWEDVDNTPSKVSVGEHMAILVKVELQDWLQALGLQLKMRRIIGCTNGERCGGAQRNAFLNMSLTLSP
jgi:hypothetical protein